jgi:hypothetical protein
MVPTRQFFGRCAYGAGVKGITVPLAYEVIINENVLQSHGSAQKFVRGNGVYGP